MNTREFIKTIVIGLSISAIIFLLDQTYRFLSGYSTAFDNGILTSLGFYILYGVPLTFVNVYLIRYINRTNKKRERRYNLLIGVLSSVIVTLLAIFVLRIVHRVFIDGMSFRGFLASENGGFYFVATLIALIISLFFHAFHFYKALQENRVKEQKIIAGTASAQFDALKNQLDPHFLFNSLNVLTSLIDERPQSAQKFTTSLSKIYRYVLEQKNKELVSVEEELQFAKTYVGLLKMRFEDSIEFDMPDKPDNPEAKVVPLSLQLLLENAVKHNTVTARNPLKIKIFEEGGNLVVRNNMQRKQVVKKGSGVGLANISQRYDLLTERKVMIKEAAPFFEVRIPMLTKQIESMNTESAELNEKYLAAKRRVEELKEFYWNLTAYCIVIPFLIFINYRTSWDFKWFWFPVFGWGIGLAFHAVSVFLDKGFFGRSWEEKKIREYMREDEKTTRWQ
ncbi:2TM domain-containing protein [Sinomicrobium weinanense]|uniref:2TM domain-containing protein n=1 Tax=Sinomicrobium weinanense TaxID=2842200 RepID=A0A926JVD0_9FLAO|nr:2TM domain-containing protein [Sinomicrobium weinanense]MBC9798170.1 2TM domain-containing protein [Sinomicrobium weinanense]MBU3122134.1 2TM domain-containing protein [Sinomicrobium weinanense]